MTVKKGYIPSIKSLKGEISLLDKQKIVFAQLS